MEDLFLLENQFSNEEKMIRNNVKQFVAEKIIPIISSCYEQAKFPQEIIPMIAAQGLFGMVLPEEYGGINANYISYGLTCQELEYGDSAIRSLVSVQSSLCMHAIFSFGDLKQKQQFLPKMAKGELIACFGLTESDSGSDPKAMQTTAKKVNDGWILNGSKMWITNATIADLAIVWAKTPDGVHGFLVTKNSKGFSSNEIKHKMSLRASLTGELVFKDCFVPDSHYLPLSNIGLAAPLKCLTQARYGIAWGAIGAAMACYDCAKNYTLERKQFNKPIASFQLVQKDLVDMLNEIVKSQLLNLQLGRLKDQNSDNFTMVSMAKMNACQQALKISRLARNLLGANGISLEYPIIRHMQNLETVFTYEGTDNIHHLIIGRYITDIDAFA